MDNNLNSVFFFISNEDLFFSSRLNFLLEFNEEITNLLYQFNIKEELSLVAILTKLQIGIL